MLVDNAVRGDSRAQKAARSAAAAGWDVILLGRSPDQAPHAWALGSAQVRLLPLPGRGGPPLGLAPAPPASREEPGAAPGGSRPPAAAGPRTARRRGPRRLGAIARRRGRAFIAGTRSGAATALANASVAFWKRALGGRAWTRLDPQLLDFERAYGPVVDGLAPDLIHAHDFRVLGVGARAALRARAAGRPSKLVWDAHEYLPGIRPWNRAPGWHDAQCLYEAEHAPYADAVVTVSEALADLLVKRHALTERPTVVLNAPEDPAGLDAADGPGPDLRAQCGIGTQDPLVVYSGAAATQRGLATMIQALPDLAGVHVALVVPDPASPYLLRLLARAARLGVAQRVHALPYVPYEQVTRYLSAADAGVIPIHHWPNHEIALITKFFEYSHARLPLVVSDVRTMAETTRRTGQGEVFRAQDVADYVRAVRAVLADPARYRAAYAGDLLEQWTWERQAAILDALYDRLLRGEPT